MWAAFAPLCVVALVVLPLTAADIPPEPILVPWSEEVTVREDLTVDAIDMGEFPLEEYNGSMLFVAWLTCVTAIERLVKRLKASPKAMPTQDDLAEIDVSINAVSVQVLRSQASAESKFKKALADLKLELPQDAASRSIRAGMLAQLKTEVHNKVCAANLQPSSSLAKDGAEDYETALARLEERRATLRKSLATDIDIDHANVAPRDFDPEDEPGYDNGSYLEGWKEESEKFGPLLSVGPSSAWAVTLLAPRRAHRIHRTLYVGTPGAGKKDKDIFDEYYALLGQYQYSTDRCDIEGAERHLKRLTELENQLIRMLRLPGHAAPPTEEQLLCAYQKAMEARNTEAAKNFLEMLKGKSPMDLSMSVREYIGKQERKRDSTLLELKAKAEKDAKELTNRARLIECERAAQDQREAQKILEHVQRTGGDYSILARLSGLVDSSDSDALYRQESAKMRELSALDDLIPALTQCRKDCAARKKEFQMAQQHAQSTGTFTQTPELRTLADQVEAGEKELAEIVKQLEEAVKRAPDDFGRQPSELILCLDGLRRLVRCERIDITTAALALEAAEEMQQVAQMGQKTDMGKAQLEWRVKNDQLRSMWREARTAEYIMRQQHLQLEEGVPKGAQPTIHGEDY